MDVYTVSLFGHSRLSNPMDIEKALERAVRELIKTKEYVEFLIGRKGDFDLLAASVIRTVNKELDYGNVSLVLVLPYSTSEYRKNKENFEKYYDEVEICGQSALAHFKGAYRICNRSMVDRSDLILCGIERENGGAYQTIEYAIKQQKPVKNIGYSTLPSRK
ncbi:MAG: DUF1273 domain-containing protein [Ruminococcaceae bacterium]|nr:DUF1273 domain-containing protein [Oscillospiraceae bacterium]